MADAHKMRTQQAEVLLFVGRSPLMIVLRLGQGFMIRIAKNERSADHAVRGISGTRWAGMV